MAPGRESIGAAARPGYLLSLPARAPDLALSAACLVGLILALDLLWSLIAGSTGTIVYASVDEPAHFATCFLALLTLVALRSSRLPLGFLTAALLASVAIDLDHLPGYLGSHLLTDGTPRPYAHSLLAVSILLAIGFAVWRRETRLIFFGLAFGVAAHLLRDLSTGPGVPLFWPFSAGTIFVPYGVYASVLLLALLVTATAGHRRPRLARGGLSERPVPGAGPPAGS